MGQKRKILILGGGFGGVKAALELEKVPQFDIALVSDQDNFRYYPMLYHAATGGSKLASEIPLAEIFAGKNLLIVKDNAQKLDRGKKIVEGASGQSYSYDVLIVALGVVTNFFGIKGLEKYSYGIKTQDDSRRLREHLHKLIASESESDLNYVVIGAGPTGVELAGALPAYLRHIMKNHGVVAKKLHIDLVEAESRVLPSLPKRYSRVVARRLRKLGITLHLNEKVLAETADKLVVTGHSIDSHSVVWTAGVTNHPFLKDNNFKLSNHGKALVDQYLQAEPDVYIIGDNADTKYSGMAQTALRDSKFIAEDLRRQAGGKSRLAYKAKKPVYIMPVGPHWAAVLWGKTQIHGWLGWALRSLADLIAYHDLEPWWKASKRWQATFDTEETCPVCLNKRK